jgi:uncharacterized membrane protein (UPF0127 family)
MAWLVRGGEVLAAAEIASTRAARRRGAIGRDGIDGVLVLRPCRQVHTIGMRFALDVAWCGADGRVLRVATMRPLRVSRPVVRAHFVIEARSGATARWRLAPGDLVEIVDGAPGDAASEPPRGTATERRNG